MLSSDYLRQRALYCLQDLVTRYLTEESVRQRQQARAGDSAVSAGGQRLDVYVVSIGKQKHSFLLILLTVSPFSHAQ